MPKYDIALILTVEAYDYTAAFKHAESVAEAVGMEGENISACLNYEHDNSGQRVLYLHPEDAANGNEWDCDDPIVGFGGSPDFPSVAEGEPVYQSDIDWKPKDE